MTEIVGSAAIRITPDFTGFRQQLNADISAATGGLQAIKVNVEVDTSAALARLAEVQSAADRLDGRTIRLNVDSNTAGALGSLTRLNTRLDGLDGRSIRIHVNVTGTTQALADLATLSRVLDRIDGRRATARVGLNGASGATTGARLMIQALVLLGPAGFAAAAGLAPVVGLLGAIPGLAGAGAQGVTSLGLAFHGIGGAIKAQSAAATKAAEDATKGVGAQVSGANAAAAAQDAITAAVENVAAAHRDAARAVFDSQQAITRASERAAQTQIQDQRAITQALGDVQRAQEDLTRARKDALTTIRDLNDSDKDAALNLREANIALREATRIRDAVNANDAFTAEQKERAQLDFEEAQQRQIEASERATDAAKAATEANAAGVEGSQQVIAAKDKVAQAETGLADAREKAIQDQKEAQQQQADLQLQAARSQEDSAKRIEDAERQLAAAHRGAADAAGVSGAAMTSAAAKAKTAYDELTPAGKQFVDTFEALRTQVKGIGRDVQTATLPGFSSFLNNLSVTLPLVRQPLVDTGSAFGSFAQGVGHLLTGPFRSDLPGIFETNTHVIKELLGFNNGGGLTGLIVATENILVASQPMVRRISEIANSFGAWAGQVTSGDTGRQKLVDFFDKAMTRAKLAGEIIGNLGKIVGDLFRGSDTAGTGILRSLEQATEKIHQVLSSADGQRGLQEGFDNVRKAVEAVIDAIDRLHVGNAIGVFVTTLNDLARAVSFIITDVPGASVILSTLLSVLAAIAALKFVGLVSGFGSLFKALTGLPFIASGLASLKIGLRAVITELGILLSGTFQVALARLGISMGTAVAGLGAVVIAAVATIAIWKAYQSQSDSVRKTVEDTNKAIAVGTVDALQTQLEANKKALESDQKLMAQYKSRNSFQRALHPIQSSKATSLQDNDGVQVDLKAVADAQAALDRYNEMLKRLGISQDDARRLVVSTSDSIEQQRLKADLAHHTLDLLKGSLDISTPAWKAYNDAQRAYDADLARFPQTQEAIRTALSQTNDAFSGLKDGAKVTASAILKSFEDSTKALQNEQANIKKLVEAGVPTEAINALVQKGPEYVAAVAEGGKKVINQYTTDYEKYNAALGQTLATDGTNNVANMSQAYRDQLAKEKKALEDALAAGLKDPVDNVFAQIVEASKVTGEGAPAAMAQALEAAKTLTSSAAFQGLEDPIQQSLTKVLLAAASGGLGVVEGFSTGVDGSKHIAMTTAELFAAGLNGKLNEIKDKFGITVDLTDNASAGLENLSKYTKDLIDNGTITYDDLRRDKAMAANNAAGHATGGYIDGPGTSTSDSILARLSKGEYVVKASAVERVGIGALEHINNQGKLPGFAAGGLLDQAFFQLNGVGSAAERIIGNIHGGGGVTVPAPGGSNGGGAGSAAIRALGLLIASQMGYAGQFPSIDSIFSRESGWNPTAQNPTSSAYGIPQFLNATWKNYGGKTSDPSRQIHAGIQYMIDRYGSPNGANAFWNSHHWYNGGGEVGGVGNQDTIRAMLTPGEFVLNKAAARQIGTPTLERANALGRSGGSSAALGTSARTGPAMVVENMVVRETVDVATLYQQADFLDRSTRVR